MTTASDTTPQSSDTCNTSGCGSCAIKHAAVAEGLWTGLFALLPFAGAKAADAYMDMGTALPAPTMAILRFARAMHPTDNLGGYVGVLMGVGIIGGLLIVAGAIGSPEVKRAARSAAIVMMIAGVLAWIAVAAILAIPYIAMQQSLSA